METKRVNINISVKLLKELDEVAEDIGLNRTSTMIVAIKQYIDGQRALNMVDMVKKFESIGDMEEFKKTEMGKLLGK